MQRAVKRLRADALAQRSLDPGARHLCTVLPHTIRRMKIRRGFHRIVHRTKTASLRSRESRQHRHLRWQQDANRDAHGSDSLIDQQLQAERSWTEQARALRIPLRTRSSLPGTAGFELGPSGAVELRCSAYD